MMQQFLQMSIQNHKNIDASIKNLEVQVGQLAKHLADQQGSSFSANTEANKAIFTRSGKEVGLGSKEKVEAREKKKKEEEIQEEEVDEENVVEEEENKSAEKDKKKRQKENLLLNPFSILKILQEKRRINNYLGSKTYSSNLRSRFPFLKHCNKYLIMQIS